MFRHSVALSILAFALAGCAQRLAVSTDRLSEADFASYQTYSFMPERALLVATPDFVNPMLEQQLKAAANRSLKSKGFKQVENPEEADFVLSFLLGARDQIKQNSYPTTYRESWRVGGPYTETTEVRNYTEGTLSIDVFEVKTRKPVWHGRATKHLSDADRGNEKLINDVVAAILDEFPPV